MTTATVRCTKGQRDRRCHPAAPVLTVTVKDVRRPQPAGFAAPNAPNHLISPHHAFSCRTRRARPTCHALSIRSGRAPNPRRQRRSGNGIRRLPGPFLWGATGQSHQSKRILRMSMNGHEMPNRSEPCASPSGDRRIRPLIDTTSTPNSSLLRCGHRVICRDPCGFGRHQSSKTSPASGPSRMLVCLRR